MSRVPYRGPPMVVHPPVSGVLEGRPVPVEVRVPRVPVPVGPSRVLVVKGFGNTIKVVPVRSVA